jgi:hypothetical protein
MSYHVFGIVAVSIRDGMYALIPVICLALSLPFTCTKGVQLCLTLSVSAVIAQPAATHTTATGVTWKSVVEQTVVRPLPFELALLHEL